MSNPAKLPELRKDLGRPTRVRWLIFVLACGVSWMLYLHRYSWGVIKPTLQQENPTFDDLTLGWVYFCFPLTYALGQVPSGYAGDRWGPRLVLSSIILIWSATVAALALAGDVLELAGVLAFLGLAQAGAYPNLSKVTRSWFPPSIRTSVQGIVASLSGRAGGACAPLLVGSLLMGVLGLDWRAALVVIAAGGIALGVAFLFLFRNRPQEHPWSNAAEAATVDDSPTGAAAASQPRWNRSAAGLFTLLMMITYASCSTFADQFFVVWAPSFLQQAKGMSTAEMGVFASLPLWGGALGGAVGGFLNDFLIRRTGNPRWSRCAVAFTGKFLAAILMALAITMPDGRGVALVLMACKFFGDWSLSTLWGAITDVSGRASGTIFGIINMAGAFAGMVAHPAIGRLLRDGYGWEVVFYLLASVFFVSALCWFFIDPRQRLVVEEPGTNQLLPTDERALEKFQRTGSDPSEAIKPPDSDIKPG